MAPPPRCSSPVPSNTSVQTTNPCSLKPHPWAPKVNFWHVWIPFSVVCVIVYGLLDRGAHVPSNLAVQGIIQGLGMDDYPILHGVSFSRMLSLRGYRPTETTLESIFSPANARALDRWSGKISNFLSDEAINLIPRGPVIMVMERKMAEILRRAHPASGISVRLLPGSTFCNNLDLQHARSSLKSSLKWAVKNRDLGIVLRAGPSIWQWWEDWGCLAMYELSHDG